MLLHLLVQLLQLLSFEVIRTTPIPIVLPRTIVLGDVDVTNVSIIFDVFSVVIELETWYAQKYIA